MPTFPQTVVRGQAQGGVAVLSRLQDNPGEWQNPARGLVKLGLLLQHAGGEGRLQRPVWQ